METGLLREEYAPCLPPEPPAPSLRTVPDEEGAVCEVFLRQLTVVYHFIHYRLDRPFLADREWPTLLKQLQTDLRQSLEFDAVPAEWKHALFLSEPRTAEQRQHQARYAPSLRPLFAAAREKIRATLRRLEEMESASAQFPKAGERNLYLRREAAKICQWALQKSWEVVGLLGWEKI